MRQLKREVKIGNVTIGGKNPIAVQTMLNVPVEDIEGNVAQAKRCEAAGCQILRVTCPSAADAKCIEAVKNAVNIPIVADIHFDYKAAIACADVGVDKIRINPGNIGDDDRVKAVVDACQQKNIPIRIGVNGGSLEKHILAKYGAPVPEAMVESALYHVRLLEKFDFNNIVISIKNSNVPRMMEAYRQLSAVTDYPLHVGVTEAGTYQMGLLKSGMGIGGMLLEGIGDTIRVSLAADPEKEVEAGYNILRAVGFPVAGPEVITCPTCGRTQYPCTEIANEVERRLQGCKKSIKVAVMGCVVNGPGEAREADIGIAGGKGEAVLFVHGNPVRKLTGDNILDQFMEERILQNKLTRAQKKKQDPAATAPFKGLRADDVYEFADRSEHRPVHWPPGFPASVAADELQDPALCNGAAVCAWSSKASTPTAATPFSRARQFVLLSDRKGVPL